MPRMSSADIRKSFLDYFAQRQHQKVASSPLVPAQDPSLLFTNAGMVQFKHVFLGSEQRDYARATSSQCCLRAGGKHNDLEEVGRTLRHHTFFEMLGNFSFGDYFKREAISFAWEYLTGELKLDPKKLWVTVYKDDQETEDIWLKEMGIDSQRFSRCGEDNFWSMGDTGPCGPCTEIFYDHGDRYQGGPPGSPDEDGDRYVEIWNLVFMQYNRQQDGRLDPLPKPSVDTGMGLERITAVMQGVADNYSIDIFKDLISAMQNIVAGEIELRELTLRVVSDHIRAATFLLLEGVMPGNEGRSYVLRRIMRRAIRYVYQDGYKRPFLAALLPVLIKHMGEAYPNLSANAKRIAAALEQEERQFSLTLEQGMGMLEARIPNLEKRFIPGELAFQLYDTYGFPIDLTQDIANEKGLDLDLEGFAQCMEKQRSRSKEHQQFKAASKGEYQALSQLKSEFVGYEQQQAEAKVIALGLEGKQVKALSNDELAVVVLDQTPFYPEGGGQVGDKGLLFTSQAKFKVEDTQKQGTAILHIGRCLQGTIKVKDNIRAEVDVARESTRLNHSATHLLHAVLRQYLGEHVLQKGSLVAPDRLRFDFSHPQPCTLEQLHAIEEQVNYWIRHNVQTQAEEMPLEQAKESGAMALFGEKYGEKVRVCRMGDLSVELCGGTHVQATGEIGLFKIISETGIAAGVRRIEALTGEAALSWVQGLEKDRQQYAALLKSTPGEISAKIEHVLEKLRKLKQANQQQEQQQLHSGINLMLEKAEDFTSFKLIATEVAAENVAALRALLDQLLQRMPEATIIVLAKIEGDKVQLLASMSKDLVQRGESAVEVLRHIAAYLDGSGGGRADFAQGAGRHPERLEAAWKDLRSWLRKSKVV
jgi:alanyl-tRNA synthetase